MKIAPQISFRILLLFLASLLLVIEVGGQFYHHQKYGSRKSNTDAPGPAYPHQVMMVQDQEVQVRKPEKVFRLLVFGGSAAQGFGGQTDKGWPYLLAKKLKPHLPNKFNRIEVVNFAGGSFTSIDDYVNLKTKGLHLSPDLILVYHGWNDIVSFNTHPGWMRQNTQSRLSEAREDLSRHDLWTRLSHRFFIIRKIEKMKRKFEKSISEFYAKRDNWKHAFLERIRMIFPWPQWDLQKKVHNKHKTFDEVLADTKMQADYFMTYPRYHHQVRELFESYYGSNVQGLIDVSQAQEVPILFIFQPDLNYEASQRKLSSTEEDIAKRLMGSKTKVWREMARDFYPIGIQVMGERVGKADLEFVNMVDVFHGLPGEEVYQDTVHYTEAGNQKVSDSLYQILTGNPKLYALQ